MRRAVLLALATLTAACGCAHPHARKPATEFRPGATPSTTRVPYDATYSLVCTGRVGDALHSTHLVRGEEVGFRRETDGSVVAVARGRAIPLGDGAFAWVVSEEEVPPWHERAAHHCRDATAAVGGTLILAGLAAGALALATLYASAESSH